MIKGIYKRILGCERVRADGCGGIAGYFLKAISFVMGVEVKEISREVKRL